MALKTALIKIASGRYSISMAADVTRMLYDNNYTCCLHDFKITTNKIMFENSYFTILAKYDDQDFVDLEKTIVDYYEHINPIVKYKKQFGFFGEKCPVRKDPLGPEYCHVTITEYSEKEETEND